MKGAAFAAPPQAMSAETDARAWCTRKTVDAPLWKTNAPPSCPCYDGRDHLRFDRIAVRQS